MRFSVNSLAIVLPVLLGMFVVSPSLAQTPSLVGTPAPREFETRAQLELQARNAESQGRKSEAWLLRFRLKQGDFQEGDRIVVTVGNNPPRTDTMQVRAGKTLPFGAITDVPLEGVLRSELSDTLRHHLSKFLVNPIVRTLPLLPIAVFGDVGNPGYHYVAADVLLRDFLMRVGIGQAEVKKAVVKRGEETIWSSEDVRIALTDGLSMDRLHLRAGDEVVIPRRRGSRIPMIITLVSTSVSMFMLFTGNRLY